MNWRAPAHRTRLVRVDVGEESRGRANHHHDQRQRASAARPKRSVGRDGRRDRIGEGSVAHLTLTATAGPSSSRLGGRVRSVWRHQRRRIEIGIYLTGDNAMPRGGGGEGAGAWAHFLPTWSRRTRRAWFLFFRRSPSRFRQLGSTTGEVQNLSINVVCALHGTHGVKTKS